MALRGTVSSTTLGGPAPRPISPAAAFDPVSRPYLLGATVPTQLVFDTPAAEPPAAEGCGPGTVWDEDTNSCVPSPVGDVQAERFPTWIAAVAAAALAWFLTG